MLSTRVDFTERLTPKKNCLSFDCGLKHLAYCLIEDVNDLDKEFSIRLWETFSLHGSTVKDYTQSLFQELALRPWMVHVDHVVIEAQVSSNNQMKVISHILQMYFLCKRNKQIPTIHFINPKSKFKVTNVPEPSNVTGHAKNKKVAVEMAKKLMSKNKDRMSLEYFMSFRKQDDLADSFLQGLYFLRTARDKVSKNLLAHLELNINEDNEENSNVSLLYKAEDFVLAEQFNIDARSLSHSFCFKKK